MKVGDGPKEHMLAEQCNNGTKNRRTPGPVRRRNKRCPTETWSMGGGPVPGRRGSPARVFSTFHETRGGLVLSFA